MSTTLPTGCSPIVCRRQRNRLDAVAARAGFVACVALLTTCSAELRGQTETRPEIPAGNTLITLEIAIDRDGVLNAQAWRDALQSLNIQVRMQTGLRPESKPEIRERVAGSLRYVQLKALLDRRGQLVFADRMFTRAEVQKLKEWIRELETYGAQGAPDGQPAWGLNKEQFKQLITDLSERVKEIREGDEVRSAVKRLHVGSGYGLRFSSEAETWLNRHTELGVARQNIVSLSRGTALAVLLNDAGLGFRPLRTPAGEIELVIEPLSEGHKLWPPGWELPKDRSRYQMAPKLFELLPVSLDNVPLVDVVGAISIKTQLPVVFDRYEITTQGEIDLEQLMVSYPSRKVTWLQVLRGICSPNRLSVELVVDERDRPFLRIGTLSADEPAAASAGPNR